MDTPPSLATSDIRRRVGTASFDRAQRYVGRLEETRREGFRLRALCQGTAPEPYAVEATLGLTGIVMADCSCPVGAEGRCKHVAALLLTWLRDAQAFPETPSAEEALATRTREDLVAIVREMVALYPSLEALVTAPPGGTVSARAVERQVRRLFATTHYEWGAAVRIGRELDRLVRRAAACAAAQDWPGVIVLCGAVLDGVLDHDEWLHDESGAVMKVVLDAVAPLGACLAGTTDAETRREAVGYLFAIVRAEIALGGIDVDARALLLEHATDAERADLARQIEVDLSRHRADAWRQKALGALLLALVPGEMDDETFLRIARASGRTADVVGRLLELDRADEAIEDLKSASDHDLVALAPAFVERGLGEALATLALERRDPHPRLAAWLRERGRGDAALAAILAERMFFPYATARTYAEALTLGRDLGHEDAVRTALRARLREKHRHELLVQVCLLDDDPGEAIRTVHETGWERSWERAQMRLVVADAVAEARPEDAVEIYLEDATALVERRGRENYTRAAALLAKVRAVYRSQSTFGSWGAFVGEIREAYASLPAFLDEMKKAGLGPTPDR